jgi:transcriptional regulator with XRE-family HTH domain
LKGGLKLEIDKIALGNRIQAIRKQSGMTLKEFGEIIDNADKSLVSRWEKGLTIPNNARLRMIADRSNLSVNELLFGDLTNYVYALAEEYKENPPSKEAKDSLENMSEDQYKILLSLLMARVKEQHLSYEGKETILAELDSLVVQHFFDFSIFGLADFPYALINYLDRELAGLKEGLLLHEDEKEDYTRWIELIEKFISDVEALQKQK